MKAFLKWILFVITGSGCGTLFVMACVYNPLWLKLILGFSSLILGIATYFIVKFWHYDLFGK